MVSRTPFILILLCLLATPLLGQQSEAAYLREASTVVDDNRYAKVRGTAYRYDSFLSGTLYDTTLNPYELDSLNFNGHTSAFEYYLDGTLRSLNNRNFLRAEVQAPDGREHVYAFGINPHFPDRYAELIFQGEHVTATMIYDVANDEKVVQDVGKTVRLQRFNVKEHYYAMVDGDLIALSSGKRVAEELGFKQELTTFIKNNKLKPGRYDDLISIVARAEELHANR